MFCEPCGDQVLRFDARYWWDPRTEELPGDYGAISAVFDQNRIRRATQLDNQSIQYIYTDQDYVDQLKKEISHAGCKLDAVIEMYLIMKLSREQLERGNLVQRTKSGMNYKIAQEMGATIGLLDNGPSRGGHLDYATYYAFWACTHREWGLLPDRIVEWPRRDLSDNDPTSPVPFTLAHLLIPRRCQDPKFDPDCEYERSPLNGEDEPLYDELRTAAAVIELGSIKERALFRWL